MNLHIFRKAPTTIHEICEGPLARLSAKREHLKLVDSSGVGKSQVFSGMIVDYNVKVQGRETAHIPVLSGPDEAAYWDSQMLSPSVTRTD